MDSLYSFPDANPFGVRNGGFGDGELRRGQGVENGSQVGSPRKRGIDLHLMEGLGEDCKEMA